MSDHWLQLIPIDSGYQPSQDAAECARTLLAAFVPQADNVAFRFTDDVKFFHPGSNWQGVQCSACGVDAESWWSEAMDAAHQTKFENLVVATSCCGASASLNELHYVWPAGFGRFVLEAMNPNVSDLRPSEEAALGAALGCRLRKIWVHL